MTKNYCPYCGVQLSGVTRDFCTLCNMPIYNGPRVAACALLENNGGLILVLRKLGLKANMWSLPGGILESGESPSDAATRETSEETGFEIKIEKFLDTYFDKNDHSNYSTITHVFKATTLKAGRPTANDIIRWRAFKYSDIPWKDLAFESTKIAILQFGKKSIE